MSDPHEGENLDQIYNTLRWPGVELAAQRIAGRARSALEAINRELVQQRRLHDLAVVVPDDAERAAYLEAAEGNPQAAQSWAQLGIPPELGAEHPEMPLYDLAKLAARNRREQPEE